MFKKNQKILFLSVGLFFVAGLLILTSCTKKTPVVDNNNNTTTNTTTNTQNQNNGNGENNNDFNKEKIIEEIDKLVTTTEEESPTPKVDTTGWQTYRNEELGFEAKIPQGWYAEKDNHDNIKSIKFYNENEKYYFEGSEAYGFIVQSSDVFAIFKNSEEYIKHKKKSFRELLGYGGELKKFQIDNKVSYHLSHFFTDVYIVTDNGLLSLQVITSSNANSKISDLETVFNGFVQTFKFLD